MNRLQRLFAGTGPVVGSRGAVDGQSLSNFVAEAADDFEMPVRSARCLRDLCGVFSNLATFFQTYFGKNMALCNRGLVQKWPSGPDFLN
jgi:hypothetical protein